MKFMILTNLLFLILSSCNHTSGDSYVSTLKPLAEIKAETIKIHSDTIPHSNLSAVLDSKAEQLVDFAETLKGIQYKYGSTDPKIGFDCSGFITYVFNHFDMKVPRSSIGFTTFAKEIELKEAKRGDLILFTGTDSTKRVVGHMGIITSDKGEKHEFIHSTSGKAYSVTNTPLNKYYQGRFVKAIRIFKENDL